MSSCKSGIGRPQGHVAKRGTGTDGLGMGRSPHPGAHTSPMSIAVTPSRPCHNSKLAPAVSADSGARLHPVE